MPEALIHARSLSKSFDTGGETLVHALRGVDVEINEGELTVLMGSSGSGKSTLLYLLSGLESLTSGEISIGDSRIDLLDETELSLLRRKDVGFVYQAIHLIPHLTLLENILVPGYLVERDRQKVRERALQLLDGFGIQHLASRLPAQVSGGEQQRAAIARALINSPRALLADEPTGALNSAAGREVLESLHRISQSGQTVVMATHEVRAACYGDRVLYLRDGQLLAEYRHGEEHATPESREEALTGWLVELGW